MCASRAVAELTASLFLADCFFPQYCVFGKMVSGESVLRKMEQVRPRCAALSGLHVGSQLTARALV